MLRVNNCAQRLHRNARECAAWSIDAWPELAAFLTRIVTNQHGRRYTFCDGSWYFIPKGYAHGSIGYKEP